MNEPDEIWLPIQGYEGVYEVSNYGEIKTLRCFKGNSGRIIKGSYDSRGYPHIQLFLNGEMTCFKKHILVARAFIQNPHGKRTVNHKNGIKTDNRVSNLEWCTDKENIQHAIDSGLRTRNQNLSYHPPSKLTPDVVDHIKNSANKTLEELSIELNISQTSIWKYKKKLQLLQQIIIVWIFLERL